MSVRRVIPRAAASAVFGIVAALVAPLVPFAPAAVAPVASAAPAGDSQVVAFVALGLGNGAVFALVGTRSTYEEVDCALKHRTETVHVGTYPSPAAEAADPPAQDSAGARAASGRR